MSNPYQILGVSQSATDEEIKAKYRELAKKYHPDNYADTPMQDYASDKMKEINQAYDSIVEERRTGKNAQGGTTGQNYSAGYNYAGRGSAGASQYPDVRRFIQMGRLADAEQILDGVPTDRRNAEWFFLKGTIQLRNGWTDMAYQNLSKAHSMDPGNPEFAAAVNHVQGQRSGAFGGFNTSSPGQNAGGCSCCDICCALYCMDACCNCF